LPACIASLCPGRYRIVLVGKEPHPPYNRVLLSSLLAGEVEEADLGVHPRAWFAESCAELICGDSAIELRPAKREVVLASGARLVYDRLILATGSNAIRLPVPSHDLAGVTTFRDLADVEALCGAGGKRGRRRAVARTASASRSRTPAPACSASACTARAVSRHCCSWGRARSCLHPSG
jgi:nitrite reductase (NADH) large subunit